MTITIKSADEIEKMRIAGRLGAQVLEMIEPHVKAGVTTETLNALSHDYIVNTLDCIPAPLNYRGSAGAPPFPKSICTSINHVVCHGIPGPRQLKNGDIVNIDVTVIKDGFHGDTSKMFLIGEVPIRAKRLCQITQESLYMGIRTVKPGMHLGDIGATIQRYAESQRLSVVRDFCGHGIGRGFHEDPQVLHFGSPGTGPEILQGMTFTIEPMLNIGKPQIKVLPDRWTAITKDRSLSAQWEHTILVTETGYEILTLREEETVSRVG